LEKDGRSQSMSRPSQSPVDQPNEIVVRVLKHDGSEHRRWTGRLARLEADLIILEAEFDTDVSHHLLGDIKRGTRLIEHYWLNRWYNVFRFLNDDGSTRLYYCNINKPPDFDGQLLTYVDLDIDVMVRPDFSYEVLDLDEFTSNSHRYGYSPEEKASADNALGELTGLIQARDFPFQSLKADAVFGIS
jgi:protein associated with RNAse G/E